MNLKQYMEQVNNAYLLLAQLAELIKHFPEDERPLAIYGLLLAIAPCNAAIEAAMKSYTDFEEALMKAIDEHRLIPTLKQASQVEKNTWKIH